MTLYRRWWSRPSSRKRKAKWFSEEALQIAEKRREAKGKGEKERYIHLNVELQRIARRDKKAFLSDQCKEIEENNRMGKTRDLLLQCSCLKNPRDEGAWWAAVYGVAQSWTQLRWFSSSSSSRDLFKKIRDTKGTFHAKMGSIKDKNGTDLTETEDIKKRRQEYTEELYKKRS